MEQSDDRGSAKEVGRRKAVVILVVATLSCVSLIVVTGPGSRPAYPFLKEAQLRYTNVSGGICTTSFFVRGAPAEVQKSARDDLPNWTAVLEKDFTDQGTLRLTSGSQELTVVGWTFGEGARSSSTHVLYDRPAALSDYPRAWVSRIQSWF